MEKMYERGFFFPLSLSVCLYIVSVLMEVSDLDTNIQHHSGLIICAFDPVPSAVSTVA